jgi:hypothetical protein
LVQDLCTTIAEAGAMRLEVDEGGVVDVLLPPMLAITTGAHGVSITIVVEGRDEAQQARAITRELEGVELALQPVRIGRSSAAEAVVHAVLEHGASRVVVEAPEPLQIHPPLFEAFEKSGRGVRIAAAPTGDRAMDARMLARELPGRLSTVGSLAGVTVTVVWPGGDATAVPLPELIEALVKQRPAKVLLDGGTGHAVQVHPEQKVEAPPAPPLVPASTSTAAAPRAAASSAAAPRAAAPAAAAVATGSGLLTLIGRRDEAIPPMVLLGVEDGDADDHVAAVEAELQSHLPRFRGRAVLLVPQQRGADVPVRRPNALVEMLGRVVPGGAAATLVFRGPDAQGRPHFQVLHSHLRALPVGGVFGDPRAARQAP